MGISSFGRNIYHNVGKETWHSIFALLRQTYHPAQSFCFLISRQAMEARLALGYGGQASLGLRDLPAPPSPLCAPLFLAFVICSLFTIVSLVLSGQSSLCPLILSHHGAGCQPLMWRPQGWDCSSSSWEHSCPAFIKLWVECPSPSNPDM